MISSAVGSDGTLVRLTRSLWPPCARETAGDGGTPVGERATRAAGMFLRQTPIGESRLPCSPRSRSSAPPRPSALLLTPCCFARRLGTREVLL
jgi:hypothetical protein